MASIWSTSGSPSTLKRIEAQPSAAPMTNARAAMTRMAVSIARPSLDTVQAGEAHEGQAHQAGRDHGDGRASKGQGDVGTVKPLADTCEQHHRQRETERRAEPEQQ